MEPTPSPTACELSGIGLRQLSNGCVAAQVFVDGHPIPLGVYDTSKNAADAVARTVQRLAACGRQANIVAADPEEEDAVLRPGGSTSTAHRPFPSLLSPGGAASPVVVAETAPRTLRLADAVEVPDSVETPSDGVASTKRYRYGGFAGGRGAVVRRLDLSSAKGAAAPSAPEREETGGEDDESDAEDEDESGQDANNDAEHEFLVSDTADPRKFFQDIYAQKPGSAGAMAASEAGGTDTGLTTQDGSETGEEDVIPQRGLVYEGAERVSVAYSDSAGDLALLSVTGMIGDGSTGALFAQGADDDVEMGYDSDAGKSQPELRSPDVRMDNLPAAGPSSAHQEEQMLLSCSATAAPSLISSLPVASAAAGARTAELLSIAPFSASDELHNHMEHLSLLGESMWGSSGMVHEFTGSEELAEPLHSADSDEPAATPFPGSASTDACASSLSDTYICAGDCISESTGGVRTLVLTAHCEDAALVLRRLQSMSERYWSEAAFKSSIKHKLVVRLPFFFAKHGRARVARGELPAEPLPAFPLGAGSAAGAVTGVCDVDKLVGTSRSTHNDADALPRPLPVSAPPAPSNDRPEVTPITASQARASHLAAYSDKLRFHIVRHGFSQAGVARRLGIKNPEDLALWMRLCELSGSDEGAELFALEAGSSPRRTGGSPVEESMPAALFLQIAGRVGLFIKDLRNHNVRFNIVGSYKQLPWYASFSPPASGGTGDNEQHVAWSFLMDGKRYTRYLAARKRQKGKLRSARKLKQKAGLRVWDAEMEEAGLGDKDADIKEGGILQVKVKSAPRAAKAVQRALGSTGTAAAATVATSNTSELDGGRVLATRTLSCGITQYSGTFEGEVQDADGAGLDDTAEGAARVEELRCSVCGSSREFDPSSEAVGKLNPHRIVQCGGCGVRAHADCYGAGAADGAAGLNWKCDLCAASPAERKKLENCALCSLPLEGLAARVVADRTAAVHVICMATNKFVRYTFSRRLRMENPDVRLAIMSGVKELKMACAVCEMRSPTSCMVQCEAAQYRYASSCCKDTWLHPSCALASGMLRVTHFTYGGARDISREEAGAGAGAGAGRPCSPPGVWSAASPAPSFSACSSGAVTPSGIFYCPAIYCDIDLALPGAQLDASVPATTAALLVHGRAELSILGDAVAPDCLILAVSTSARGYEAYQSVALARPDSGPSPFFGRSAAGAQASMDRLLGHLLLKEKAVLLAAAAGEASAHDTEASLEQAAIAELTAAENAGAALSMRAEALQTANHLPGLFSFRVRCVAHSPGGQRADISRVFVGSGAGTCAGRIVPHWSLAGNDVYQRDLTPCNDSQCCSDAAELGYRSVRTLLLPKLNGLLDVGGQGMRAGRVPQAKIADMREAWMTQHWPPRVPPVQQQSAPQRLKYIAGEDAEQAREGALAIRMDDAAVAQTWPDDPGELVVPLHLQRRKLTSKELKVARALAWTAHCAAVGLGRTATGGGAAGPATLAGKPAIPTAISETPLPIMLALSKKRPRPAAEGPATPAASAVQASSERGGLELRAGALSETAAASAPSLQAAPEGGDGPAIVYPADPGEAQVPLPLGRIPHKAGGRILARAAAWEAHCKATGLVGGSASEEAAADGPSVQEERPDAPRSAAARSLAVLQGVPMEHLRVAAPAASAVQASSGRGGLELRAGALSVTAAASAPSLQAAPEGGDGPAIVYPADPGEAQVPLPLGRIPHKAGGRILARAAAWEAHCKATGLGGGGTSVEAAVVPPSQLMQQQGEVPHEAMQESSRPHPVLPELLESPDVPIRMDNLPTAGTLNPISMGAPLDEPMQTQLDAHMGDSPPASAPALSTADAADPVGEDALHDSVVGGQSAATIPPEAIAAVKLPRCVHCAASHSSCSGTRPCARCVEVGLECGPAAQARRAAVKRKAVKPVESSAMSSTAGGSDDAGFAVTGLEGGSPSPIGPLLAKLPRCSHCTLAHKSCSSGTRPCTRCEENGLHCSSAAVAVPSGKTEAGTGVAQQEVPQTPLQSTLAAPAGAAGTPAVPLASGSAAAPIHNTRRAAARTQQAAGDGGSAGDAERAAKRPRVADGGFSPAEGAGAPAAASPSGNSAAAGGESVREPLDSGRRSKRGQGFGDYSMLL